MEVITYEKNEEALKKLHEQINEKLEKGFMISKAKKTDEKIGSRKGGDAYNSYRSSSKGFFNNLTAGNSVNTEQFKKIKKC